MVSVAESSRFFAVFSEKAALFDECVASKNVQDCRLLIQECQSLVSAHSAGLPSRDLQVYKERIEDFKRILDKIKEPKKKFGFSRATKEAHDAKIRSDKVPDHETLTASIEPAAEAAKAAFFLENRTDVNLQLSDVHGEVELRNLRGCKVTIRGNPATLYISEVHDCLVVCDPVASSVLIVGFRGSELRVACQQLRIHKAGDAIFRLHISSRSIIEDCRNVSFGKLPAEYNASEQAWEAAGLSKTKNNYSLVDDFNWLNVQEPSPNWKLLD
ncbi:tubulin-specific chaperone C [Galendromus occidentalis]|uniref:Tubulin-specific chaperone C n=1 Tax=Galendromus occidentalis TaxID=34638 RepID=A0AAJ6W023_9ACAR|nr:tubulin-specific chaperone C [Galendromus occidentalis]